MELLAILAVLSLLICMPVTLFLVVAMQAQMRRIEKALRAMNGRLSVLATARTEERPQATVPERPEPWEEAVPEPVTPDVARISPVVEIQPSPVARKSEVAPEAPAASENGQQAEASSGPATDEAEEPPTATRPEAPRRLARVAWRPVLADSTLESRIGKVWMVWVGAASLLLGIGFLYRLMVTRGLLPEEARFGMGLAASTGLLTLSRPCLRRDWTVLAQGLAAAGAGLAQLTIYSGFGLWGLYGETVALVGMSAVTVFTLVLAWRLHAQALAVLALVAGFVTPWLAGGSGELDVVGRIYTVLLVAGFGTVLAPRRWDHLGFLLSAGVMLTFLVELEVSRHPHGLFAIVLWLSALWAALLLTSLPGLFHAPAETGAFSRRRAWVDGTGWLVALLAAGLLRHTPFKTDLIDLLGDHQLGLGYLFAALLMAGVAATYLKRNPVARRDRLLALGGETLLFWAAAMTTGALYLLAPDPLVPAVIVALAMRVLWVALAWGQTVLRLAGHLVLGFAVLTLLRDHHDRVTQPIETLPPCFTGAGFLGGMATVAVLAAGAALVKGTRTTLSLLATGLLALLLISEIEMLTRQDPEVFGANSRFLGQLLSLIVAQGGFLAAQRVGVTCRQQSIGMVAGLLALVVGLVQVALMAHLQHPATTLLANTAFAFAVVPTLLLATQARVVARHPSVAAQRLGQLLGASAAFVAWVGLSYEVWNHFEVQESVGRQGAHGAVSVAWSVYAAFLLCLGIARRLRPLRIAGLTLFLGTAVKVVLADLAHLDQLWRVVAFIGLGVLLLFGAWLYNRFSTRLFGQDEATDAETEDQE